MVNKAVKGRRYELLCRDMYEQKGYKCLFKSQRIRFGKIDFGGLFDLVMAKGKERAYISVKAYRKFETLPRHQSEILTFKEEHGLQGEQFILALHRHGRWTGRMPKKLWIPANWHFIEI